MNSDLSSSTRYNAVSQFLHWLTVFCILIMYATAWGRSLLPETLRDQAMPFHKSIGITILAITVFRIVWRFLKGAPLLPEAMPKIQVLVAKITHLGLYGFLLGIPALGWLMISAFGKPLLYFNLVAIPVLVEKDRILGVMFKEWHEIGATLLFWLIGLHIAGALYHHFIQKDGLINRMLPARKK